MAAGLLTQSAAVSLLPHTLSQSISERVGRAVARTGLTPNLLTLIGLLGMGGAGYLAAIGWFWQAGLLMLAAGAFDLFDGAVARYTNQASDWGAVFDAVSDRLADFAILFGLLFWYLGEERFDRTAIILIMLSLSGSMLVSYTRSKAAEFGIQIRSGLGTRLERLLIMAIGLLSGQVIAILWLLAALSNLTELFNSIKMSNSLFSGLTAVLYCSVERGFCVNVSKTHTTPSQSFYILLLSPNHKLWITNYSYIRNACLEYRCDIHVQCRKLKLQSKHSNLYQTK